MSSGSQGEASEETNVADALILELWENNFLCLCHPVSDILLWQHKQTDTRPKLHFQPCTQGSGWMPPRRALQWDASWRSGHQGLVVLDVWHKEPPGFSVRTPVASAPGCPLCTTWAAFLTSEPVTRGHQGNSTLDCPESGKWLSDLLGVIQTRRTLCWSDFCFVCWLKRLIYAVLSANHFYLFFVVAWIRTC